MANLNNTVINGALSVTSSISEGGTPLSNKYIALTSANRYGVTRLFRRDDDSAYNVQTWWNGSYWVLQGYYQDSYHAPCSVGYAESAGAVAWSNVSSKPSFATVATSGSYNDLSNTPTSLPASDVYSWAKASTKPSYSWSEISSRPTALSSFTNDVGYVTTDHTYNFAGTTFNSGDNSTAEHNANSCWQNGVYYYTSNGPSNLGEESTDGALYVQNYSSDWVAQIAQDYRSGKMFVRSKKNGTWQSWKRIPYASELPTFSYSGGVLTITA